MVPMSPSFPSPNDRWWAWLGPNSHGLGSPNKMGELLDASGTLVKSFSTWDRGTLIDKYGAKFYHDAPSKAVMAFLKGDKGWQVAGE
jgi:hypothetical protein